MLTPCLRSLSSIVLLILLPGCGSLTQIVPLQAARISQNESYLQSFSFLDDSRDQITDSDQRMLRQTQRMDQVFRQLLGEQNWQNLKDLYGLGNLRKELLDKQINIRGTANLVFYPDPFDERLFSIEGSGRFFLIRNKNSSILLSGDYLIPHQQHRLAEMEQGAVILDIKLFISRIPGQLTYLHETPLKYLIRIDNRLARHRVFSIDYQARHLASLAEGNEPPTPANSFASISFTPPEEGTKLIDFRGIQYLRRDYRQLLEEARP